MEHRKPLGLESPVKVCVLSDDRDVRYPHIRRLFPGLVARGLDVHIVTRKPVDLPGVTVELFRVPPAGLTNPRRWHRRQAHYLRGFFERFDVVNVQFLHDWGLTPEVTQAGCFVASAWGSDIVPPPGERLPSPELTASRRALLRSADCVTACGPTFAREVESFVGLPPGRVEVVPFGVDVDLFRPAGDPVARSTNHVVGFFKGFREVYGPKTLIRAIPIVREVHPTTRFEFVGDGPQLDECKALASELGLDSCVDWIPRRPNEQMPDLLARWDLTVTPSSHEAFGVAALEASAMRVPVVASDVGGLRDTVIDGETGLRVPANRPEALASAIVWLLKDTSVRRRMGAAGRAFVQKNYSSDVMFEKWLALFQRARDRASVMV